MKTTSENSNYNHNTFGPKKYLKIINQPTLYFCKNYISNSRFCGISIKSPAKV